MNKKFIVSLLLCLVISSLVVFASKPVDKVKHENKSVYDFKRIN